MKEHLRGDKELTRRVADACATFANKLMPEQVTYESYQKATSGNPSADLSKILQEDEQISDLICLSTARAVRKDFVAPADPEEKQKIAAMDDRAFADYIKIHISSEPKVAASGIAYLVCEAHRYFLQKQLTPTHASGNTQ